tara:strand:- start:323 stop:724 length:402 start_codon:yes stop_codon:yes gene_type:complete
MIDLKIINLASNTKNYGLKKNSTHYAYCKNKICGDKIKIEVNSNGVKIKNMRYETESCIFCQASASILSGIVKSIPIKNLKKETIKIYASFDKENFSLPKKYNLFKPLINKKNKSRLECVMLPFNAILKALKI